MFVVFLPLNPTAKHRNVTLFWPSNPIVPLSKCSKLPDFCFWYKDALVKRYKLNQEKKKSIFWYYGLSFFHAEWEVGLGGEQNIYWYVLAAILMTGKILDKTDRSKQTNKQRQIKKQEYQWRHRWTTKMLL